MVKNKKERIKKNRKAQIRVQQMAFMILGLTIFFALVGLFVFSFIFSGLKDSKKLLNEQEATLLVSRLANSPEFSCGKAFGTQKLNCVDLDKVFVLKEKINDYSDFWGVKGIEIRKLYPKSSRECTESSYSDCGFLEVLKSENLGVDKSTFVSLCRKVKSTDSFYNKCELGRLIVRF